MRIAIAQLAPRPAEPARNLERLGTAVRAAGAELAVFPELFLSGYRIGDRVRALALSADGRDPTTDGLRAIAGESGTTVAVGAPVLSADRPGEVHNAVVLVRPDGGVETQVKRYLPNFGPFEEGIAFSPTATSRPLTVAGHPVGFEICYDVFFPEVTRALALGGAELLVNLSASPVTSRRLFEHLLPARAVENGVGMVYVNRVGVEDGFVFGGGSGAWDLRGEPLPPTRRDMQGLEPEESVSTVEVDLSAVGRWRPFRPVLRDLSARPAESPPR